MRFSLRQLLIGITFVSLFMGVISWLTRWPRVEISSSELANRQQLLLTSNKTGFNAFDLELRVKGHLDGSATLLLPWDNHEIDLGPGEFSEYEWHDFYDNQATILYIPGTARSGKLVIEYRFSW